MQGQVISTTVYSCCIICNRLKNVSTFTCINPLYVPDDVTVYHLPHILCFIVLVLE